MSERDELLDWMTTWQAEAPLSEALRETVQRRVARSQRRWVIETVCETVVTVVGLAVTTTTAWLAATTIEWVAMVSLSIVIVAASWVSWRYRRGLWHPPASSTQAWLDFLERRAHLRLRATSAAVVLLVVEVAIFIPWVWARATDAWRSFFGFTLLAAVTVAFTVGLVLERRAARRELAQLSTLQHELEG